MKRHHLIGLTTVVAATLAALGLVAPAQAAARRRPVKTPYQTTTKVMKQFKHQQAISKNRTLTVDIVLKPMQATAMTQLAKGVSSPNNPDFKQFLTPTGFRAEFGQPASVTGQYEQYLRQYHLSTKAFQSGLVIAATGKVKDINQAFATNLQTAKYHQNPIQFSKTTPKLPSTLAGHVLAVLGIVSYGDLTSQAVSSKVPAMTQSAQYAPQKFVDRYHVQGLYDQGLTGAGQTIGVITFAGFNPADATTFWSKEGLAVKPNRVTTVPVASATAIAAAAPAKDDVETTLDVEQSGAIAPQADIRVYEASFNDVGWMNAYSTAFDDNVAGSLSMSWGLSESITHYLNQQHLITPVYGQVLSNLMMQGAIQGVSTFVASGDTGAYNEGATKSGKSSYLLTADIPADNPWVTATGGTTLPIYKNLGKGAIIDVSTERTWGGDAYFKLADSKQKLLSKKEVQSLLASGSGGGFSHIYQTPWYQQGVPGVGTFNARDYYDAKTTKQALNAPLITGAATGRNYPDISADADPMTGYQIYYHGKWQLIGGTSAVAPQFNGVAALINSGRSTRMGFWNPQLYQLAQTTDSPMTVLDQDTNNSNLYYVGQPGKVYNQASGLGIVNVTKLWQQYR